MFRQALRRLVLIDVISATAAVILLLAAAFFLIRTNLERTAYQSLQEVAETIAASDLHELFEEDESGAVSRFSAGPTSYWIVGPGGNILTASTFGLGPRPVHSAGAEGAASGQVERAVVRSGTEQLRVVTVANTSHQPPFVVQVATPDTVGPELVPIVRSLMITGLLGVVIAAGAGAIVAHRTLRPLQKAFDLQRDFISGASHELRTPVSVIQANADALQRLVHGLGAEDARLLSDLQLESEFLGQLVGRLAELARLQTESGIPLETVDLGQLARELSGSMDALANRAGMTILAKPPSAPVCAVADRVMLRQLVQSLVDNALKYAGRGSTVELSVETQNGRCQLTVMDNGTGIPEQDMPHVTERFYRVDKARSRKSGGSGLGLAIAHEAVSAMGGTLTINSREGDGTAVTVTLAGAIVGATTRRTSGLR